MKQIKILCKKLVRVFTTNVGLKLIALVIAILAWLLVMVENDPYVDKTIKNVSVNIINEDYFQQSMKIGSVESGDRVTIVVHGPRSEVSSLNSADFTVTANFRDLNADTNAVPINVAIAASSQATAANVTIKKQTPSVMKISLEDMVSKKFTINVNTSGEAASGSYVSETIVSPNIITVMGSQADIDQIKKVAVDVNVSGASESFSGDYVPKLYNEYGEIKNTSSYMKIVDSNDAEKEISSAKVDVNVLATKQIFILVSVQGSPATGYECVDEQHLPTEVTIAGAKEDLDDIIALTIPFDISNTNQTVVEQTFNIQDYLNKQYADKDSEGNIIAAKYICIDENQTVSAQATLEKLESRRITVLTSTIDKRNLEEGYSLNFKETTVNVMVYAIKDVIDTIKASDLNLYVDADGLGEGSYEMTIKCDPAIDLTMNEVTIEAVIN